jgi:diphthamide biosynthesis protein 2
MTTIDARMESYDIAATAAWIRQGKFSRVALQLPDDALNDAADVARAVTSALDDGVDGATTVRTEVFVLADTTFGSCCVDEVAAAHRDADAIVHYGRACCSPTSRTPARFVFGRKPIDVDACARALMSHAERVRDACAADEAPRALVCVADQEYFWALDALRRALNATKTNGEGFVTIADAVHVEVVPTRDAGVNAEGESDGFTRVGASRFRTASGAKGDECAYVWIGGDGPAMTHAMLVLSDVAEKHGGVAQYDPSNDGDVRVDADGASEMSRALKRRRYLIARAKEAQVVGIVAGTLGVAGYRDVIADLRRLIANSGRKSYTIVAGKPNPQKLANFPEIEVFIMVSCELTALMDGREYMQPIITPYEATIAFTSGAMWMGEVKLDFASVSVPRADGDEREDGEEPEFSLISGSYRTSTAGTHTHETAETDALTGTELARRAEGALSIRADGASAAVTSGAEYLISRRTYTGLEPGPKRDEDTGAIADAPLDAARGQSGRARSYAQEHSAARETEAEPSS